MIVDVTADHVPCSHSRAAITNLRPHLPTMVGVIQLFLYESSILVKK